MSWWSNHTDLIGVEVGSRYVRMLQLEQGAHGLKVYGSGQYELPIGVMVGEVDYLPGVVHGISTIMDTGHFVGKRAVLVLPESNVLYRSFREVVGEGRQDVWGARGVPEHVKLGLGVNCDDMALESVTLGRVDIGDEGVVERLLMGAPKGMLDMYVKACEIGGLEVEVMEPGALALARAVGRAYQREEDQWRCTCWVDLGYEGARMWVMRGAQVLFYRQLGVGVKDLNQALYENRGGRGVAGVHVLKHAVIGVNNGVAGESEEGVMGAISEKLGELIEEVKSGLAYCVRTFAGVDVEEVELIGGGANAALVVEAIGEGLGMDVKVSDVFGGVNLHHPDLQLDRREGLNEWAICMGASLRAGVRLGERRVG